jgi:uncharacterized membrane protein
MLSIVLKALLDDISIIIHSTSGINEENLDMIQQILLNSSSLLIPIVSIIGVGTITTSRRHTAEVDIS